jgi:hypothetical protein
MNAKKTTAHNIKYIVSDIGVNKDNYAIESRFHHNLITDEITVKYNLVKNWIHPERKPDTKHKEGAKYRERIASGDYYALIDIVKDIVIEETIKK